MGRDLEISLPSLRKGEKQLMRYKCEARVENVFRTSLWGIGETKVLKSANLFCWFHISGYMVINKATQMYSHTRTLTKTYTRGQNN